MLNNVDKEIPLVERVLLIGIADEEMSIYFDLLKRRFLLAERTFWQMLRLNCKIR